MLMNRYSHTFLDLEFDDSKIGGYDSHESINHNSKSYSAIKQSIHGGNDESNKWVKLWKYGYDDSIEGASGLPTYTPEIDQSKLSKVKTINEELKDKLFPTQKKYTNTKGNITEHNIVDKVVLKPVISKECSLVADGNGAVCMSKNTENNVKKLLKVSTIDEAKEKTKCRKEKCVLETLNIAHDELKKNYKVDGSLDTTLLNNNNIDQVLEQWSIKFKSFYPYNFNMKEYDKLSFKHGQILNKPDSLHTVNWADLYNKGYRTSGCVINTDSYYGRGKHWMAFFVDCRSNPVTIEFFNSSGNEPETHWIKWMYKTKKELESVITDRDINIISVTKIRQQQSKTECGVYSLYYIWTRLHEISWMYFAKVPVPDQIIVEFRQHLFDDKKEYDHLVPVYEDKIYKFNYDKFKKHISWE